MDNKFILTERENLTKYTKDLLEGIPEESLRISLGSWDVTQRKRVQQIFDSLSETLFLNGLKLLQFSGGNIGYISPVLGQVVLQNETISYWNLLNLIEDVTERHLKGYADCPLWKVEEYFFNIRHDLKVSLEFGFPEIDICDGYLLVKQNWHKYPTSAVEKNLKKLIYHYKNFLKEATIQSAQQFMDVNLGILNKCKRTLSVDTLMQTMFPKLKTAI